MYPGHGLLDHLEKLNRIDCDEKQGILEEHAQSGRSVESLVLGLEILDEEQLLSAVAYLRGCSVVDINQWQDQRFDAFSLIPYEVLERCCALPLGYNNEREELSVAMADVADLHSQDLLAQSLRVPGRIVPLLGRRSEIMAALQAHMPAVDAHSPVHCTIDGQVIHGFLYGILVAAAQRQASDIHFDPEKIFVRVRMRCDGMLHRTQTFHIGLWQSLCVQLKVLSGMDISETRKPQDGRFSLPVMGRPMDFRMASHPTLYGEKVVLRLLDPQKAVIALEDLGYSGHNLACIRRMVQRPEGLIIVTGPTGSGKTTSLYSMLGQLDKAHKNIMTLEEPIEYTFGGILQSEVREKAGLTFVAGMHSILRQDPDVILIGEIRDQGTADMAIRAAMTGHLVLTTLHTLNALGTLHRLRELDVPTSLLAGLLSGIVAQRLVRVLCALCKKIDTLTNQQAQSHGLWPQREVFCAVGCAACGGTGYAGRKAIAETLIPDGILEELILSEAPHGQMQAHLASRGFASLRDSAIACVLEGVTSIDELNRVLGGV
jgi:type II secretory ATPase GspE/PulE/Tfp pilus assembly ATPase PilB-like protein